MLRLLLTQTSVFGLMNTNAPSSQQPVLQQPHRVYVVGDDYRPPPSQILPELQAAALLIPLPMYRVLNTATVTSAVGVHYGQSQQVVQTCGP
jgi:tRNA(Leu) C34 or U34 (ribose-2'-O)-methylase TrmL